MTMQSLDDHQEVRLLTVGKPLPGNEINLVDEAGREVEKGEPGEIVARGPGSVSGYYQDKEATWQAWTKDGWFKTGDLGEIRRAG